jgi:hypothetical protein
VLAGHRSKVFFAGVDDPSTVDYVSKVAGTEHVAQRSWNAEVHGHHRSISEQPQQEDLLPSHLVRQLAPQDAVLIHGTLPPVHLRLVRWWRDPELRRLVPTDERGRPRPPEALPTCPLTDEPAERPGPVPDPAVIEDPARRLPGRQRNTTAQRPPTPTSKRPPSEQRSLWSESSFALPEPDGVGRVSAGDRGSELAGVGFDGHCGPHEPNRVAGICNRCNTWIKVGDGKVVTFGRRQIVRCYPKCSTTAGR